MPPCRALSMGTPSASTRTDWQFLKAGIAGCSAWLCFEIALGQAGSCNEIIMQEQAAMINVPGYHANAAKPSAFWPSEIDSRAFNEQADSI